jgi:hypothetical protein
MLATRPGLGQHWSFLIFDVSTIQEFYMKEISSMDFPQNGEIFYFYGQAVDINLPLESLYLFKKTHQNPLGSFIGQSIYIGTDSGKLLFYTML